MGNSGADGGPVMPASGRPRSIPPEAFDTVLQLYAAGHGYRSIANELSGLGIGATYSSVRRLVKGQGAYSKCPACDGTGRVVYTVESRHTPIV